MAASVSEHIEAHHGTPESQATHTNSDSSSVGAGFHSHLNEDAETDNAYPVQLGDQLSCNIPFSVDNVAENGASLSHLMRDQSIAQASSSGASLRRLFSLSGTSRPHLDEDLENEIVSLAGDIGDRVVSRRGSQRESVQSSSMEQGVVFPIAEELLDSYGFWSHNHFPNTISPVSPLVSEIVTPPSTSALLNKKQVSMW